MAVPPQSPEYPERRPMSLPDGCEPRVQPLPDDQLPDHLIEMFQGRTVPNVFRVLATHNDLLRRWLRFGTHVLYRSSLERRDVELLILRTGWLCNAEYEFSQHTQIGLESGLTADEIARIVAGPADPGWSRRDSLLLQLVDELEWDLDLTDETWAALQQYLSAEQVIDCIFTVGQYHLAAMALRTLRVPADDGSPGFPSPP